MVPTQNGTSQNHITMFTPTSGPKSDEWFVPTILLTICYFENEFTDILSIHLWFQQIMSCWYFDIIEPCHVDVNNLPEHDSFIDHTVGRDASASVLSIAAGSIWLGNLKLLAFPFKRESAWQSWEHEWCARTGGVWAMQPVLQHRQSIRLLGLHPPTRVSIWQTKLWIYKR